MDTTSTDRPASSPPPAPSGTAAISDNKAIPHAQRQSFCEARSYDNVQNQPTEQSFSGLGIECDSNNEQVLSSPGSPSHYSSASSASHKSSPLPSIRHDFNNDVANMTIFSTTSPPEAIQARSRMLSAPLPSVPPSTPTSALTRRIWNVQTSDSLASPTHPAMIQASPAHTCSSLFASPLVRHSSGSDRSQESEASDSASVEIISANIEDSFVNGRFEVREGGNVTRGIFSSTREPSTREPSSTTSAAITQLSLSGDSGLRPRPSISRTGSTSTATSVSQTPTHQHLKIHGSSSSHSREDTNSNGSASDCASVESASYHLLSKSPSPSRAQARVISQAELHDPGRAQQHLTETAISHAVHECNILEDQPSQPDDSHLRTPNVYINGLPPHFPDESLFAMTREFGHVLSVRTFTRCVGEKMSGYGFVLFDSVEAAERCIEALRKYRNLHPSFSKQVHKIPGTPYASGAITIPPTRSFTSLPSQSALSMATFPSLSSTLVSSNSNSSLRSGSKTFSHQSNGSLSGLSASSVSDLGSREMTFREKMERLKDERSTNLYMEGLPLTIDDVSLAALVSPHNIISSRFFQTKLSDPPRMIAFVRLDSRQAAEEVIERLHGRVVRGWNDNGCRISVRFADTNEQRELRRSERLGRGEEEDVDAAGRLSMAQAALLNLRGAEAQAQLNGRNSRLVQNGPVGLPYDAGYAQGPSASCAKSQVNSSNVASNSRITNSFRPLTIASETAIGQNTFPEAQSFNDPFQAQQYTSALARREYFHPFPNRSAAGVGLANMACLSPTSMHLPINDARISSSLSLKSVDANRLALMQQEAQLQQLQVLQQLQLVQEQQGFSFPRNAQAQGNSLMPPVDIMTSHMNDQHMQAKEARSPVEQAHARQQMSHALLEQQMRGTADNFRRMPSEGVENAADDVLHETDYALQNRHLQRIRQQHQSAQRRRQYTSEFGSPQSAADADFLQGHSVKSNNMSPLSESTTMHARTEHIETSTYSPALTYASRTPSTLSPATPLFNAFGTPASAPATFPAGKSGLRDRERQRLIKHDTLQ